MISSVKCRPRNNAARLQTIELHANRSSAAICNTADMSDLAPEAMPGSIDQFYSHPDNRIVPIVEALRFSVKKAQGEDPARLVKEIADRAAHWSQPGSGLRFFPRLFHFAAVTQIRRLNFGTRRETPLLKLLRRLYRETRRISR